MPEDTITDVQSTQIEQVQPETATENGDFGLADMVDIPKTPYPFPKEKMKQNVALVKKLITEGAVNKDDVQYPPLQNLRLQLKFEKNIRVSSQKGYVYIDRLVNKKTRVDWARIGIFDSSGKDCVLAIYNSDGDKWVGVQDGNLYRCLKYADLLFADSFSELIPRPYKSSNEVSVDEIPESSVVGRELTEDEKTTLNNELSNGTKPYKFSAEEMKEIVRTAVGLIEALPHLKDHTKVVEGKGYITLHQGAVKLAQINIYDKEYTDCELLISKKGKPTMQYTRGTLGVCLDSADAISALGLL
jgi:hypothetical protein